jgi:hypothetical protein
VAGRAPAQDVIPVVAAAFYGTRDEGARGALQPVMAVIERAAPGAVQLVGTEGTPGFAVAARARAFPVAYEGDLRRAAQAVLAALAPAAPAAPAAPGLIGRVWHALQRLFSSARPSA